MTTPLLGTNGSFPDLAQDPIEGLSGILPTWALSTGTPTQMWGLAEAIVRGAAGNQELVSLAAGLLAWSWQMRPFHQPTVSLLLALDSQLAFLAPANRDYLARLKKLLMPPQGRAAWEEVKAGQDPSAKAVFMVRVLGQKNAVAWLGEVWEDMVQLEDQDLALGLVVQAAPDNAARTRLEAELALHQGRRDKARALAEGMWDSVFAPFGTYLAGHLAARRGESALAAELLGKVWRAIPWHANLTLKLYDQAMPPFSGDMPQDPTAILIYTWNKAELAGQTLDSVLASRIGDSRVFVLDNGSSDATAALLAAKQRQFGPHRLSIVSLPVNVGAPAARNWLLSLPEVRACRYAAFLDDDVLLPADWLAKLLGAAKRHPQCATVGCAIRDHALPHRLQSADYHLLPDPPGQDPGERVRVFNNCTGELDLGMFDYERPCLSVSGCCHLLDLSALAMVGGFDVRFTPTQFDDLDRDMRSWLAGRPCLYAGGLRVDHVQRSSLRQATTSAAVGHVMGNKIKLDAKYDEATLADMAKEGLKRTWADLSAKHQALRGRFSG